MANPDVAKLFQIFDNMYYSAGWMKEKDKLIEQMFNTLVNLNYEEQVIRSGFAKACKFLGC